MFHWKNFGSDQFKFFLSSNLFPLRPFFLFVIILKKTNKSRKEKNILMNSFILEINTDIDLSLLSDSLIFILDKFNHLWTTFIEDFGMFIVSILFLVEKSLTNINCLIACLCVHTHWLVEDQSENKRDNCFKNLAEGNQEWGIRIRD